MKQVQPGADQFAQELGLDPITSVHGPFSLGDETVFHQTYRAWRNMLIEGIRSEQAGNANAA